MLMKYAGSARMIYRKNWHSAVPRQLWQHGSNHRGNQLANNSVSIADQKKPSFLSQFLNLRLLLIFLPIALIARIFQWGDLLIFVSAGLAIVPLSELFGDATEALAAYLGPA